MNLPADYQPEFESIKDRLLQIAQIHSVDTLIKRVAHGFLERPHVALAQIWLVEMRRPAMLRWSKGFAGTPNPGAGIPMLERKAEDLHPFAKRNFK